MKVNFDGSLIPGQSHGGWGVVVRDAAGEVLAAQAGRNENVYDAFDAEVNSMSTAVALVTELGAIRLIFETDCQLLVEALDLGNGLITICRCH